MPRRNLQILLLADVVCLVCCFRVTRHRYAPTIADAMGIISEYYIEPVDRRSLYENAMQGMLGNLDEYSGYIPPVDYSQLQEELDQEFAGVGIEVGIDPNTNRLIVLSPIVKSPAYFAAMRAGDLIMEIDGQDTEGLPLEESVKLMRGAPGTSVALVVRPFGTDERKAITVERANVQISSVLGDTRNSDGTWNYVLANHPDIAYMRLVNFGEATSHEVAEVLELLLDDTIGVIIDLRGNPGGLLTAAVEVCDLFLEAAPVVSVRRRSGYSKASAESSARDAVVADTYESTDNVMVPKNYPVVVLIDKYSASASEIVSACLQDYHRATIVGQRSWGKGTVQNVFGLEGGKSAIKLTTATYWRPSGTNIHRFSKDKEEDDWGVKPDEGCEIVYDDEDLIRRFRDRRIRDFIPEVRKSQIKIEPLLPAEDQGSLPGNEVDSTPTKGADRVVDESVVDNGTSDGSGDVIEAPTAPETTVDAPFVDTQLERAVKHIESTRAAPARKVA